MGDILPKDLITLTEATCHIPGRNAGKRIGLQAVHRWANRGLRGVKLRTMMVGGHRMTTLQWLREFLAAINGLPAPTPATASDADSRLSALGA